MNQLYQKILPNLKINLNDIMKPEIDTEHYKNWITELTIEKVRDIFNSGKTGEYFYKLVT